MHRLLPLLLALIAAAPAVAQPPPPEDTPLALATVTCEKVAAAPRLSTRHLASAELGAVAARAGRSRFSIAAIDAADEAIRTGCAAEGAASRAISAIVAAVPPTPDAEQDLDLATLTCLGLAPTWRQVARNLVPFMVGWRDAASEAPLTRGALDKVGEGLPRICREEANQDRGVADVLTELR